VSGSERGFPQSSIEFQSRFATESACAEYLFERCWPAQLVSQVHGARSVGDLDQLLLVLRLIQRIHIRIGICDTGHGLGMGPWHNKYAWV
jgi:hypothetical protein